MVDEGKISAKMLARNHDLWWRALWYDLRLLGSSSMISAHTVLQRRSCTCWMASRSVSEITLMWPTNKIRKWILRRRKRLTKIDLSLHDFSMELSNRRKGWNRHDLIRDNKKQLFISTGRDIKMRDRTCRETYDRWSSQWRSRWCWEIKQE